MAVFAIVFVAVLWLQTCTAQNYQKLVAQGKGFDGNPAWDWLQNLTIPLPKYTYNSTAVEKIDEALYQRWVFAEYVQSWLDFFEDYDLAQLNWSDPSTFVCSTSDYVWDTNYTDPNRNSCSDGSFVSTPWFVVDDLTYVPPYELCNFDSDPYCDVYRNATLQAINSTGDFLGELKKQKEEATKNNTRSQYLRIGNILGVGYNVTQECRDNINAALRDADEFTSAGTQAATTIAALIPALLTVGNLFVPRSSEVFATSFLVGIMTAMFSLGLPVSSISAIKDSQRFDVSSWVFKARRSVTKFGEIKNRATDGTKNQPKNPCSLQELQRWSKELPDGQEILTEEQTGTDLTFSDIKKGVQKWKHRTHLGGLPALFISCSQFFLFLLTVGPLYFSQGTPWLLFDCRGYWTSTWMFVAAGVSAIFRVFMWERGSHERVKLYSMSDTTLERFRWFTGQNVATSQKAPTAFVEESMPPLYPPLIAKIESIMWKVVFAIVPFFHPEKPQHRRHSAAQPSIHTQEKNSASRRWKIFLNDVRNPKQFIKHAFARSEPPAAARRWRPLYLLLHLSTAGRNPIWTLLTGFIQGFILIVLTVFFAAQWGGNLFVMCYTAAVLLLAITVGRTAGLLYVQESARAYGLHMIETQNKDQLRGCLRILCTMSEVLVTINDAWFFEGHRLDNRPDWAHFQQCYSLGHMDEPGSTCSNCGSTSNPVLPVANTYKALTAKTTTLPSSRPLTPTSWPSHHLSRSSSRNSISAGVSSPSAPSRTSTQNIAPSQQIATNQQASSSNPSHLT